MSAEDRLRAFAKDVIQLAWDGSIDGGDVQEIALKHNLIKPEIYDPARHGDMEAVPGEDTIYVYTKVFRT